MVPPLPTNYKQQHEHRESQIRGCPHVSAHPILAEQVPVWFLEVPGHLEVMGWEWGAVCSLKVVHILMSLRKGGRTDGVQSTAVSTSHPLNPPPTPAVSCLQGTPPQPSAQAQVPPGCSGPSFLLHTLELTRNKASCCLPSTLMSSPAERRCSNVGTQYCSPTWALPNPSPAPEPPYPRSRGSQAHVLPGRS